MDFAEICIEVDNYRQKLKDKYKALDLIDVEKVAKMIKKFKVWHDEEIEYIKQVVDNILLNFNMKYFETCMWIIMDSCFFYENFVKEVTQCLVRYNSYKEMANYILFYNWPIDVDYEMWA